MSRSFKTVIPLFNFCKLPNCLYILIHFAQKNHKQIINNFPFYVFSMGKSGVYSRPLCIGTCGTYLKRVKFTLP